MAPQTPHGVTTRLELARRPGTRLARPCFLLRYSRMVSNWNLQPTGVSAFTALKPDMVS